MLKDDAVTGAAGQLGPAGDDDTILRRNDIEPLTLIVPDLEEVALTTRATGLGRYQDFHDAQQMFWQMTTIGSALGSSLLAGSGIGAILGRLEGRDGLFDVLQNKL